MDKTLPFEGKDLGSNPNKIKYYNKYNIII